MEARCLIAFPTNGPAVDFPFVEQAARLTRCIDSDKRPAREIETEYLVCSMARLRLPAQAMLEADRGYWGIEGSFHLRLDVSAGEDRSRVRKPIPALNLAMMRRAAMSVAIHWIRKCTNPRRATVTGFYDFMSAKQSKRAFSLLTARHSSALSTS